MCSAGHSRLSTQRLYFSDRNLSSVNIVLSPQGQRSFLWWKGTSCYHTHPWAHWVKCFICNAVLATKCTNTWNLIIAYITVHVISMIFQITEYLCMPTYFITFFGMTVYVNISVIYPLIQADPSRPTYPLCVPTAWGILISRQNCLLWSHWICHMYNGTHLVQASMWSGSALVKVTASCFFSTKPLPDLLLTGSLGIHSKVI